MFDFVAETRPLRAVRALRFASVTDALDMPGAHMLYSPHMAVQPPAAPRQLRSRRAARSAWARVRTNDT